MPDPLPTLALDQGGGRAVRPSREFKSVLKFPGGGEVNRCFYSLRLDTYGRGCEHNCAYCYARSVLDFRKLWSADAPAMTSSRKTVDTLMQRLTQGGDRVTAALLRGVPLRLGGMTDCFQPVEAKRQTTLRMLEWLTRNRYPYLILTKSDLVATEPYRLAMSPDLGYIQFSISTTDDALASKLEPGAALPSARLAAAAVLARAGYTVAIRVNPMFPDYPDGFLSAGRGEALPSLGWTDWDLPAKAKAAGVRTVIAGFVRLGSAHVRWIREATGRDLAYLFDPATKAKNAALHFSTEEKRVYYERLAEGCAKQGVAFSVCYDGDEDYETFRYLWADHDDCCNGRLTVAGFGATSQF